MNYELDRSLTVSADGESVSFRHACLSGRDALGLYPMPFLLRLWNLSESDYHLLRASRKLSVLHGDSVLASGSVSDVYLHTVPEGTLTEITAKIIEMILQQFYGLVKLPDLIGFFCLFIDLALILLFLS